MNSLISKTSLSSYRSQVISKSAQEVYTDASLMHRNKMAIGIWSSHYDIQSSYKLKGYSDINRAEMGAILYALLYTKNMGYNDVNILTDSATSLRLIHDNNKICKSKYIILSDSIKHIKSNWKGNIQFTKVKAHSRNVGNNNADQLARYGNVSKDNIKTIILPDDIICYREYNRDCIDDLLNKVTKLNDIF